MLILFIRSFKAFSRYSNLWNVEHEITEYFQGSFPRFRKLQTELGKSHRVLGPVADPKNALSHRALLFSSPGCTGGFSEEASRSDPQPCSVTEFPSLLARRIAYPEPHYVLFTADIDDASGQPWCPDCARMLDSARHRVKEQGGTLLEVQVLEIAYPISSSASPCPKPYHSGSTGATSKATA